MGVWDELEEQLAWADLASEPWREGEQVAVATSDLSDPTANAALDPHTSRIRRAADEAKRLLNTRKRTERDGYRALRNLTDALRGNEHYEVDQSSSSKAPDREGVEEILRHQEGLYEAGVRATKPKAAPIQISRQKRLELIEENARLQTISRRNP